MSKFEKRSQDENYEIRIAPAEIRESDDGNKIIGKIPFDTWSEDLGGFREKILPTAFDYTLDRGDEVWSLFQHDYDKVMGRRSTGTLELNKVDDGLEITISPSDASWSKDALEVIRHGDSHGFSFGFWALEENYSKDEDGVTRELISVELGEVSVVYNPAYKDKAQISVRALEQVNEFVPSLELLERKQKQIELELKAKG